MALSRFLIEPLCVFFNLRGKLLSYIHFVVGRSRLGTWAGEKISGWGAGEGKGESYSCETPPNKKTVTYGGKRTMDHDADAT